MALAAAFSSLEPICSDDCHYCIRCSVGGEIFVVTADPRVLNVQEKVWLVPLYWRVSSHTSWETLGAGPEELSFHCLSQCAAAMA